MQLDPNNMVISISHLIQLSVAPVFLLAGVAGLLNVFTGRLSRIIDKLERLDKYINDLPSLQRQNEDLQQRRVFLTNRMKNTNLSILCCTATGLLISLVIVTMFLSALINFEGEVLISIFFILAMLCLSISLLLFLKEILLTTNFINTKKSYFP
jgi:hypothetical protein